MSDKPATEPFSLRVIDVFELTGRGTTVMGSIETGVLRSGERVVVLRRQEVVATAIAEIIYVNARGVDPGPLSLSLGNLDGLRPEAGDQIVSATKAP